MPFSLRRLSKNQLLAICVVAALAIGGLALGNRTWLARKGANTSKITAAQKVAAAPVAPKKLEYVRQGRLWPQLRKAFQSLGDRLEKPGKERIVLVGTLSRASKATKDEVVRLVFESDDKMRLEEKDGVTIINNKEIKASKGLLKKEEQEEAESLLFDSADSFFAGQMQGQALRYLGNGFRVGTEAYDLYQLFDSVSVGKETQRRIKFYAFHSTTQLLDHVRYETGRNGKTIKVEIKFSQWQKVSGQQIPGVITRTEDGIPVLTFTRTSANVIAKSNDGLFSNF